jgi:RNase P/RNase MRP subunit p29
VRDDFGDEWVGKEVEAEVAKGANVVVLRGRVVDVARYWLKMMVDGGVVYVNKAAIVSIKSHQ